MQELGGCSQSTSRHHLAMLLKWCLFGLLAFAQAKFAGSHMMVEASPDPRLGSHIVSCPLVRIEHTERKRTRCGIWWRPRTRACEG